MRERVVGTADRRDAETYRYFECALSGARHDALGRGTDLLGDRRGRLHA